MNEFELDAIILDVLASYNGLGGTAYGEGMECFHYNFGIRHKHGSTIHNPTGGSQVTHDTTRGSETATTTGGGKTGRSTGGNRLSTGRRTDTATGGNDGGNDRSSGNDGGNGGGESSAVRAARERLERAQQREQDNQDRNIASGASQQSLERAEENLRRTLQRDAQDQAAGRGYYSERSSRERDRDDDPGRYIDIEDGEYENEDGSATFVSTDSNGNTHVQVYSIDPQNGGEYLAETRVIRADGSVTVREHDRFGNNVVARRDYGPASTAGTSSLKAQFAADQAGLETLRQAAYAAPTAEAVQRVTAAAESLAAKWHELGQPDVAASFAEVAEQDATTLGSSLAYSAWQNEGVQLQTQLRTEQGNRFQGDLEDLSPGERRARGLDDAGQQLITAAQDRQLEEWRSRRPDTTGLFDRETGAPLDDAAFIAGVSGYVDDLQANERRGLAPRPEIRYGMSPGEARAKFGEQGGLVEGLAPVPDQHSGEVVWVDAQGNVLTAAQLDAMEDALENDNPGTGRVFNSRVLQDADGKVIGVEPDASRATVGQPEDLYDPGEEADVAAATPRNAYRLGLERTVRLYGERGPEELLQALGAESAQDLRNQVRDALHRGEFERAGSLAGALTVITEGQQRRDLVSYLTLRNAEGYSTAQLVEMAKVKQQVLGDLAEYNQQEATRRQALLAAADARTARAHLSDLAYSAARPATAPLATPVVALDSGRNIVSFDPQQPFRAEAFSDAMEAARVNVDPETQQKLRRYFESYPENAYFEDYPEPVGYLGRSPENDQAWESLGRQRAKTAAWQLPAAAALPSAIAAYPWLAALGIGGPPALERLEGLGPADLADLAYNDARPATPPLATPVVALDSGRNIVSFDPKQPFRAEAFSDAMEAARVNVDPETQRKLRRYFESYPEHAYFEDYPEPVGYLGRSPENDQAWESLGRQRAKTAAWQLPLATAGAVGLPYQVAAHPWVSGLGAGFSSGVAAVLPTGDTPGWQGLYGTGEETFGQLTWEDPQRAIEAIPGGLIAALGGYHAGNRAVSLGGKVFPSRLGPISPKDYDKLGFRGKALRYSARTGASAAGGAGFDTGWALMPDSPGGTRITRQELVGDIALSAGTGPFVDLGMRGLNVGRQVASDVGRATLPSEIHLPNIDVPGWHVGLPGYGVNLPGGFIAAATSSKSIPKLLIPQSPEGEVISGRIFDEIARTGSYDGVIGDTRVHYTPSRFAEAMQAANPDVPLFMSATPVGNIIAAGPKSMRKPGLGAAEQHFFAAQGEATSKFMGTAAFGAGGGDPSIHVYAGSDGPWVRVLEDDGSVKWYKGGYESEKGIRAGDDIPPSERVSGVGIPGGDLYLSQSVLEPSFRQRLAANVGAIGDLATFRRHRGEFIMEPLTPEGRAEMLQAAQAKATAELERLERLERAELEESAWADRERAEQESAELERSRVDRFLERADLERAEQGRPDLDLPDLDLSPMVREHVANRIDADQRAARTAFDAELAAGRVTEPERTAYMRQAFERTMADIATEQRLIDQAIKADQDLEAMAQEARTPEERAAIRKVRLRIRSRVESASGGGRSSLADLERADLERADLERADLKRADLERADLERADLERPDLERPDLERPDLERPDLERPDLERPDLERPDLERPDLERPDLERPDLERPDLERPDLERPDLERPDLERPDLERPDLERPDLERPDLERPDLERPDLERPEDVRPVNPRPVNPRPVNPRPVNPRPPGDSTTDRRRRRDEDPEEITPEEEGAKLSDVHPRKAVFTTTEQVEVDLLTGEETRQPIGNLPAQTLKVTEWQATPILDQHLAGRVVDVKTDGAGRPVVEQRDTVKHTRPQGTGFALDSLDGFDIPDDLSQRLARLGGGNPPAATPEVTKQGSDSHAVQPALEQRAERQQVQQPGPGPAGEWPAAPPPNWPKSAKWPPQTVTRAQLARSLMQSQAEAMATGRGPTKGKRSHAPQIGKRKPVSKLVLPAVGHGNKKGGGGGNWLDAAARGSLGRRK